VKKSRFPLLYLVSAFAVSTSIAISASQKDFIRNYKGAPYQDARHQGGAQEIPGRVECSLYDRGGEGVAYHDVDAKNNGSGSLNPADGTYLNQFRMDEGVDISYTKFHDQIDDSPYNVIQPTENQLYVGWTEPGEWFNITVEVARAGAYSGDLLYTSNRGGTISLDVNGKRSAGPLVIASTYNASDPVAWRQWHHWNILPALVKLHLPRGKSVLTIHILTEGNMNLAYFDFKPPP
jgi:hypothetical protein